MNIPRFIPLVILVLFSPMIIFESCVPIPSSYDGPAVWKTYQYPEFGFSIDSPYPIDMETTDDKSVDGDPVRKIEGEDMTPMTVAKTVAEKTRSARNPDYGYFIVGSQKQAEKRKTFDREHVVKMMMGELQGTLDTKGRPKEPNKGFRNFKCRRSSTTLSGVPAVLLTASWDYYDHLGYGYTDHTQVFLIFKGGQYWMLWESTSNESEYRVMLDRVKRSFRIVP